MNARRFAVALGLGFALLSIVRAQESPSDLPAVLQELELRMPRPESLKRLTTAVANAPDPKAANDALAIWLCEKYAPDAMKSPAWTRVAGLHRWTELFTAHPEAATKLSPATRAWLLGSQRATHDFFDLLCENDRIPTALSLLEEFHTAKPGRFPKYDSLAVAMALVWDVPPRPTPHRQVSPSQMAPDTSTPLEKFRFWVETHERKAADCDLATLGADDLKFVVDATAPLDELRWAQKSVPFNRGNFERAYSSVRYDQKRLETGIFLWPHPEYRLEDIRKIGGICVDQAYFAAMSGKASGIPTLFFHGEGRRGGHAWFGYLRAPGKWNTDCGRYLYDKFATGSAWDAQRSEEISDHEVAFLNEEFRGTPAYAESSTHLQQARLFRSRGDATRALAATDAAIKLCPMNLDAWHEKGALLAGTEFDAHLKAMLAQFARYPDVKAECMKKQGELARAAGDSRTAALLEDQIVRENRGKRHDLSAEVFQRQLTEACEKGDWAAGQAVIHEAVMKLRNETGTVLDLLREFAFRCKAAGHEQEALRALDDFRKRMPLDPIVRGHLDSLQSTIKSSSQDSRPGAH